MELVAFLPILKKFLKNYMRGIKFPGVYIVGTINISKLLQKSWLIINIMYVMYMQKGVSQRFQY